MTSKMESACQYVAEEWRKRQPVVLDNSTGWHVCRKSTCTLVHLRAYVCMHESGMHISRSKICELHGCTCTYVKDVYGCSNTGITHICDGIHCHKDEENRCEISGISICEPDATPACIVPQYNRNKKNRRRRTELHTTEQTACIFLYDILFSTRRRRHDNNKLENTKDMCRRQSMRYFRAQVKLDRPIYVQKIVEV